MFLFIILSVESNLTWDYDHSKPLCKAHACSSFVGYKDAL